MDGKVCIVTGGAGSIGLATAKLLLERGARVMLVDRDETRLEQALAGLGPLADRAAIAVADVSDAAAVKSYVERTVDAFGKIDVVFANAGISGALAPIAAYPEQSFAEVMAVNVTGPFLAIKYGSPQMNDGGSIVVTSSITGLTGEAGISAYATSKHAVIGLVRVAAKELAARNIRVNAICPGPIDDSFQLDIEERLSKALGVDATEFLNSLIPLGRHGTPDEVARLVCFLASDESSFSTGGVFTTDGGMSI